MSPTGWLNRPGPIGAALLAQLALLALLAGLLLVSRAGAAEPHRATAQPFKGTPTVGALFANATTTAAHFCTASVIASPRGDLLITAAHCLLGTGRGLVFAPGFHDGASPDGRWTVTAVHMNPGWLTGQSIQRDYAFLTVAPRRIHGRLTQIQQVTGANRLTANVTAGTEVTVPAYNDGSAAPITCTAKLSFDGRFPAFNCSSYVDGSSGAPFLVRSTLGEEVVGVIGGLHQGGCQPSTSYSAPFGTAALATYAAAVAGTKPDVAPAAGSDGCSSGL